MEQDAFLTGATILPPHESGNCATTNTTDFIGTQIGFDVANMNFNNGGSLAFGLTAGTTTVKSKDTTPGEGRFSADFEVPFAGIYAALASGPVSLDAQIRWDAYRGELTDNIPVPRNTLRPDVDPANQALYGQLLNANALTFLWNAAYRYDVQGSNWFIEPSVGGIWSRARIDKLDVSGNFLVGDGKSGAGAVEFDDIQTLLGRASVRVGTTFVTSGMALQQFLVASVFHEFAGDVQARMGGNWDAYKRPGDPMGSAFGQTSTSRVGSYGHIGVGLAGIILDTGWLGYIRGDYRKGDYIEGLSFNAGLRYQFTPSNLDDKSLKQDADHYSTHVNWTGPYIGLFGGSLFSQTDITQDGETIGPRASGAFIGGQAGYNMQFGNVVLGPEIDWGMSNSDGSNGCPGLTQLNPPSSPLVPRANFWDCHAKVQQLGIIGGRVGRTWQRALFYVKGGLAIGEVDVRSHYNVDWVNEPAHLGESKYVYGWALGGGIEFALNQSWSIKGEYMHFDLDSASYTIDRGTWTNFTPAYNQKGLVVDGQTTGDSVRIGVNYRFNRYSSEGEYESMK